jgi:hypothetical protein
MAISRMQEPRQLYGLGSLVKSIGKTVKKVVKSDLGKAALLAAVGFGIPGTSIGGLLGRASFGGAAPGVFGLGGIGNALGAAKGTLFGQAGSRVGEFLYRGRFFDDLYQGTRPAKHAKPLDEDTKIK